MTDMVVKTLFGALIAIGITVQSWSLVELVSVEKRLAVIEATRVQPQDLLELTKATMVLGQQLHQNSNQISTVNSEIARNKEAILDLKYRQ